MTRTWVLLAVAGLVGLTIGLLWPPIILDDPFWRSFWSGPPVAGLFAVVGAFIAYAAARVAARTARQGAEREEWWARAEWALNLARSDKRADRLIGLRALEGLQDQATASEFKMIIAVVEAVAGIGGEDAGMDTAPLPAENRWWKRWSR